MVFGNGLFGNDGEGLVDKSYLTLATPWNTACQAPLSMGFSRQEYGSGLPFPSPGGLPDPGIEPASPALQVDSLPTEPPGKPLWDVFRVKGAYEGGAFIMGLVPL